MSTPTTDGLKQEIDAGKMKVGNTIVDANGFVVSAPSSIPFLDSSSKLSTGNIPFAMPLVAGISNTANSVAAVEGSTTLAANVEMTTTIVKGLTASFTTAAFLRVTITDDAGNLANGAYYIPIGTLA